MCTSRGNLAKLNYLDIKQLDRKAIENKRGNLTNKEIQLLVKEIHDCQMEGKLQQGIAETEMIAMKKKIQCYCRTTRRGPNRERKRNNENHSLPDGRLC
jgi:hypothetical protein